LFDTITDALVAATSAADRGDCVLVTGSLYTVADARRALT
jgi:folylpolyglutamate synthase/dihydropteroate synthase